MDEGADVTLTNTQLPKGTFVKLTPHSADWSEIPERTSKAMYVVATLDALDFKRGCVPISAWRRTILLKLTTMELPTNLMSLKLGRKMPSLS